MHILLCGTVHPLVEHLCRVVECDLAVLHPCSEYAVRSIVARGERCCTPCEAVESVQACVRCEVSLSIISNLNLTGLGQDQDSTHLAFVDIFERGPSFPLNGSHSSKAASLLKLSSSAPLTVAVASRGSWLLALLLLDHANVAVRGIV